MLKLIEYDLIGSDKSQYIKLIHPGFTKLAGASGYGSDLDTAIAALKREEGETYLLVNALSAGEYFGPNKNADYFPEKALINYHKTFELLAHVYKHHKNNDPKRSYGKVHFAHFNPGMHRVELIVSLNNERAADILERVNAGKQTHVSMGCKVPYDYCSICGNAAKNRGQYCDHLKYQANKVMSDGRKVYAINRQPKFFDLSFVTIPADRTAGAMAKIASVAAPMRTRHFTGLSADSAAEALKLAGIKEAVIEKQIEGPVNISAISDDPLALIRDTQEDIPKERLKALTDKYDLSTILSTFYVLRIMPTERDFQRLVLYSSKNNVLADSLDTTGFTFQHIPEPTRPRVPGNITAEQFNPQLAMEITDLATDRVMSKPSIMSRIFKKFAYSQVFDPEHTVTFESMMEQDGLVPKPRVPLPEDSPGLLTKAKRGVFGHQPVNDSSTKNPLPALAVIGGLYLGYQKLFNSTSAGSIDKTILKYPWLLPILIGGGTLASIKGQEALAKQAAFAPHFVPRLLVTVPGTYTYAGYQEARRQRGDQLGKVENFIRKHPFLTSLAAMYGSGKVTKLVYPEKTFAKLSYSLNEKDFDNLYNGLVGN